MSLAAAATAVIIGCAVSRPTVDESKSNRVCNQNIGPSAD